MKVVMGPMNRRCNAGIQLRIIFLFLLLFPSSLIAIAKAAAPPPYCNDSDRCRAQSSVLNDLNDMKASRMEVHIVSPVNGSVSGELVEVVLSAAFFNRNGLRANPPVSEYRMCLYINDLHQTCLESYSIVSPLAIGPLPFIRLPNPDSPSDSTRDDRDDDSSDNNRDNLNKVTIELFPAYWEPVRYTADFSSYGVRELTEKEGTAVIRRRRYLAFNGSATVYLAPAVSSPVSDDSPSSSSSPPTTTPHSCPFDVCQDIGITPPHGTAGSKDLANKLRLKVIDDIARSLSTYARPHSRGGATTTAYPALDHSLLLANINLFSSSSSSSSASSAAAGRSVPEEQRNSMLMPIVARMMPQNLEHIYIDSGNNEPGGDPYCLRMPSSSSRSRSTAASSVPSVGWGITDVLSSSWYCEGNSNRSNSNSSKQDSKKRTDVVDGDVILEMINYDVSIVVLTAQGRLSAAITRGGEGAEGGGEGGDAAREAGNMGTIVESIIRRSIRRTTGHFVLVFEDYETTATTTTTTSRSSATATSIADNNNNNNNNNNAYNLDHDNKTMNTKSAIRRSIQKALSYYNTGVDTSRGGTDDMQDIQEFFFPLDEMDGGEGEQQGEQQQQQQQLKEKMRKKVGYFAYIVATPLQTVIRNDMAAETPSSSSSCSSFQSSPTTTHSTTPHDGNSNSTTVEWIWGRDYSGMNVAVLHHACIGPQTDRKTKTKSSFGSSGGGGSINLGEGSVASIVLLPAVTAADNDNAGDEGRESMFYCRDARDRKDGDDADEDEDGDDASSFSSDLVSFSEVSSMFRDNGLLPFLPLLVDRSIYSNDINNRRRRRKWVHGTTAIVAPYYKDNVFHHFQSLAGLVDATIAAKGGKEEEEEEEGDKEEETSCCSSSWFRRLRYVLLPTFTTKVGDTAAAGDSPLSGGGGSTNNLGVRWNSGVLSLLESLMFRSKPRGQEDVLFIPQEEVRSLIMESKIGDYDNNGEVEGKGEMDDGMLCFEELVVIGQADSDVGFFSDETAQQLFHQHALDRHVPAVSRPEASTSIEYYKEDDQYNYDPAATTTTTTTTTTCSDYYCGVGESYNKSLHVRRSSFERILLAHKKKDKKKILNETHEADTAFNRREDAAGAGGRTIKVVVSLRKHNRHILNLPELHRILLSYSSCSSNSSSSSSSTSAYSNRYSRSRSRQWPWVLDKEIEFVELESLSFSSQVQTMARTDLFIAVHGSAFINAALFMRPHSACIVLMQSRHLEFVLHQSLFQAQIHTHMLLMTNTGDNNNHMWTTTGSSSTSSSSMAKRGSSFNCPLHPQLMASDIASEVLLSSSSSAAAAAEAGTEIPAEGSGAVLQDSETKQVTLKVMSAHCVGAKDGSGTGTGTGSSSTNSINSMNSMNSMTVAGGMGCLPIRNCDLLVDTDLFAALVETAAHQIVANKFRKQQKIRERA